ncbi:hypothetical protein VCHA43P282_110075 [Vibrio chagasii]|nr:hypothetical protein VCHA43P282_110075 [Vibrio chagasii]
MSVYRLSVEVGDITVKQLSLFECRLAPGLFHFSTEFDFRRLLSEWVGGDVFI